MAHPGLEIEFFVVREGKLFMNFFHDTSFDEF